MSHAKDASPMEFEILRRLGGRWAVLTAMSLAMHKKGILLPPEINERLKIGGSKSSPAASRHARQIVCLPKQKVGFFLKVPPWATKSS